MADRIRREKDILRGSVDRFIKATTEDYARYFEGSPTYIIYYQLDSEASKQDESLETVHSLLGRNTPLKYKQIDDVVVYGVDTVDIANQLEDSGLRSSMSGEFVFLPDSVRPYPGDFFVFDYDGMREHMFRIDDVQFDKASVKKFFRVSFALYPDNPEIITDNISGDFQLEYSNIGGVETSVVKKADAVVADKLKLLVDGMIKKYGKIFYDEDMDSFIFRYWDQDANDYIGAWSPYLQKFIHDNKVFSKYQKELLEEIYIYDISERDFPMYSELSYRDSFYRKVETQDANVTFQNSFLGFSSQSLDATRNLPFFHVSDAYKSLGVFKKTREDVNGVDFYLDAFHMLFEEPTKKYSSESTKKFFNEDELENMNIAVGDVIYQYGTSLGNLVPINVYRAATDLDNPLEATIDIYPIGLHEIINTNYTWDKYLTNDIFKIIRSYLRDKLSVTTDDTGIYAFLSDMPSEASFVKINLNELYFENTIQTYNLMPLLIFILKQIISEVYL